MPAAVPVAVPRVRVEQTGAARASAPAYGSAGGAPGPSGNAEPNGAVGGDLPRAAPLTRVPAPAPPLQTRSKSIIDLDPHGMKCHVAMSLDKLHKGNEMATAAAEMELALR